MIQLSDVNEYKGDNTAIVLGKFDGIHLGHRKLFDALNEEKKNLLTTVAFTFYPLPDLYFSNRSDGMIDTYEERRKLFEKTGVDVLMEFEMNSEHAGIPAREFVEEILVKNLRMKKLIAGEDVSFGFRKEGNAKLLLQLSKEYDFSVQIIPKEKYRGREISSTYVREVIANGDMELTKQLLGRNFTIGGIVVHGNAIGRTIGMPTVNVIPPKKRILPPNGVYYSLVTVNNKQYYGISNLGKKPTISDEEKMTLETHLLNCNEDLYGKMLEIALLHYVREERKFSSLEELHLQMAVDMGSANDFFFRN